MMSTRATVRPLRLKQGDKTKSMPPYEAMLRQHTKKALVDRSLPSMKYVIDEAQKHDVIERPPPPPRGGVFIVQEGLPLEVQREIFDWQPEQGEREPMNRIFGILIAFLETLKKKVKTDE